VLTYVAIMMLAGASSKNEMKNCRPAQKEDVDEYPPYELLL